MRTRPTFGSRMKRLSRRILPLPFFRSCTLRYRNHDDPSWPCISDTRLPRPRTSRRLSGETPSLPEGMCCRTPGAIHSPVLLSVLSVPSCMWLHPQLRNADDIPVSASTERNSRQNGRSRRNGRTGPAAFWSDIYGICMLSGSYRHYSTEHMFAQERLGNFAEFIPHLERWGCSSAVLIK